MYLVVNTSVSMSKGKITGQVGHAVAHLTRKLERSKNNVLYKEWLQTGETKIILKGTQELLEKLHDLYKDISVEIHDLGKTQIDAGTLTVVGFIPLRANTIPNELKELKLL